ncbi:MAG: hypothetical protein LV477_03405 [Candidatus Nitrosotalea sp.]|nr:hypothetical protein [Candidatus Nitrosotalea sp.]
MKTLHLSIIAILFVFVLANIEQVFTNNETLPKIEFNHASYSTKKMILE